MANERLAVEWNMPVRIEIIPSFDIEIIAVIRGNLLINKDYSIDDIIAHAKIEPEGTVEYIFPCTIRTDKLQYSNELTGHVKLEMYKSTYDPILQGQLSYQKLNITEDVELLQIVDLQHNTKNNEIYGSLTYQTRTIEDLSIEENPIIDPITGTRSNEIYGSITISKNNINNTDPTSQDIPNPIIDPITGIRSNEIYGKLLINKLNVSDLSIEENPIVDPITGTRSNEIYGKLLLEQNVGSNYTNIIDNIEHANEIYGSITISKNYIDDIDPTSQDIPNPIIDPITGTRSNEILGTLKYQKRKSEELTPEENPIIDPITGTRSNEIYGSITISKNNIMDDSTITPIIDMNTKTKINEIYGTLSINKIIITNTDPTSQDIPNPIIDPITGTRSNEILGSLLLTLSNKLTDLQGHVKLEIYKSTYDPILQGSVKLEKLTLTDNENYDNIYNNPNPIVDPITGIRSNEIYGKLLLEQNVGSNYTNIIDNIEHANEIYGSITISKNYINNTDPTSQDIPNPIIDPITGIRSNEIYGKVTHELMSIEEYKYDIDPYIMHYFQHNEFMGYAKIENYQLFHTIVEGHGVIRKHNITPTEPSLDDPINEEIDWNDYQVTGSVTYERDQRIIDIYCKAFLEKSGEIKDNYESIIIDPITGEFHSIPNSNELQGHIKLEIQTIKDEYIEQHRLDPLLQDPAVIIGHAKILSHYRSLDIPCAIKTNKLEFIHSIFAQITIPKERSIILPCRITVDDSNVFKTTILNGSLTILPRDKIETDLQGHVTYIPGICIDVNSHAFIDAIYTRREFDCKIDVIIPENLSILCTIDVAEDKPRPPVLPPLFPPTNHYKINNDLEPVLNRDSKRVHITIDENSSKAIQHLKKIEKKYIEHKSHIPKGKIIIVVSPTWNYEPYVFKNSLITFLDRYYRKADIAVVFGGNPRSDFDIVNLCLNYKIDKDNLCCVMADDESRGKQLFVRKFIETMVEFKKEEYPNILRVFMFINQPNWYYNDPLSAIATYCKTNNISAVAISPGGEYNEICEIDKIIDDLNSGIEWERQHRNHRTEYINIKLEDNQDRLVY